MCSSGRVSIAIAIACMSLLFGAISGAIATVPELGSARVVFQTNYGDIEFGFYHSVAPKTVEHIFKLVRLGCYNTNHFFRVDKGFVAQVADVAGGRTAPMNEVQRLEAEKTIVGEFSDVKHVRGILSMGRYSDPDSAQSSFSILLGDAPHLDGQYAIFGKVTKGDETLRKLEQVPTRTEGIFVMPTERITILSTYYYDTGAETCEEDRLILKRRLAASAVEIEKQHMMGRNATKLGDPFFNVTLLDLEIMIPL
ncbi:UNVERIFIED_CONTAM: Peptidyl-prolyl cis-trans isomerase CYP23 [Sesamum radiatum]|uniref:Peptidyl-prolyl cis-trans isomerase n=1 Tax=Sesamum radiatum TaxID=300843 RepID=A0AAW2MYN5_SESRA